MWCKCITGFLKGYERRDYRHSVGELRSKFRIGWKDFTDKKKVICKVIQEHLKMIVNGYNNGCEN